MPILLHMLTQHTPCNLYRSCSFDRRPRKGARHTRNRFVSGSGLGAIAASCSDWGGASPLPRTIVSVAGAGSGAAAASTSCQGSGVSGAVVLAGRGNKDVQRRRMARRGAAHSPSSHRRGPCEEFLTHGSASYSYATSRKSSASVTAKACAAAAAGEVVQRVVVAGGGDDGGGSGGGGGGGWKWRRRWWWWRGGGGLRRHGGVLREDVERAREQRVEQAPAHRQRQASDGRRSRGRGSLLGLAFEGDAERGSTLRAPRTRRRC